MSKQILLVTGAALVFAGAAQTGATETQAAQERLTPVREEAHAPSASRAAEDSPQANLEKWQLRRLNAPTEREVAHEREGNVYIYDGLTDREVDQALSTHFERIEHMMFLGTRKTVAEDPASSDAGGDVETESPGCL